MKKVSKSAKRPIIEDLYRRIYLEEGRRVIFHEDIKQSIESLGSPLSTSNLANFMKDIVRSDNASAYWPDRLKADRITARQRMGNKRVFEFIEYRDEQVEAFENSFKRGTDLRSVPVQSLSMPMAARALGRNDESWIVQVAVGLRVIELHFATRQRITPLVVLEVVHLQTGVKLGSAEVDALFFATVQLSEDKTGRALITCEAKGPKESILEHQIIEQIVAAHKSLKLAGVPVDFIIPIAIQAEFSGAIYLAEFEPWTREMAEVEEGLLGNLRLVAEGSYQLTPPVQGVGIKRQRIKTPRTKKRPSD